MEGLASSLDAKSQQRLLDHIVPDVLRFLTFLSLDIPHTCTHEHRKGIDAEEIGRVQDEKRSLILELNDLVPELLAETKDTGLSFPDFLTRVWLVRMDDIQSCQVPPGEEYVRQVREVGVILHDSGTGGRT